MQIHNIRARLSLSLLFMAIMGVSCGGGGSVVPSLNANLSNLTIGRAEIRMQDVQARESSNKSIGGIGNVEHIFVTVREVQLIREEGTLSPEAIINAGPADARFDLTELVDQFAELILADNFVPVGEYHQIRLILAEENTIVVNGEEHPLKVPSGLQTGIKLGGVFTLHGGMVTRVSLDFDVERSVIFNRGRGYILKPVIKIISVEEEEDATVLTEQPLSEVFLVEVNGQTVAYEIRDGFLVTEGDIIIGTEDEGITDFIKGLSTERSIVRTGNIAWPNGVIPYTVDANFTNAQGTVILNAMNEWTSTQPRLNLRFVARTNEADHVHFRLGTANSGCDSSVGRQGGQQVINLEATCLNNTFIVVHEIGHVLGLWHEQSRSDRNNFITVNTANIIPPNAFNFDQHINNGMDIGNYDFDSVMHYSATAFSVNGNATITPINPLTAGVTMGQKNHISTGDIAGVKFLYSLRPSQNVETQHVVFRAVDSSVHELWFLPGPAEWYDLNLTVEAGAPLAISSPHSYSWEFDNTEHVVYWGVDNHIHELWFEHNGDGYWRHRDLTASAGAPLAAGTPHGYTWETDDTQHVVYRGTDSHIHELWFTHNTGRWEHVDLTAQAGAPLAVSAPHGYAWEFDNTQHVIYRAIDGHIDELWFTHNTGRWENVDLTTWTGAPLVQGVPHGYTWETDDTQHVVYRGTDNHIHELWYTHNTDQWEHVDLTAQTGAFLAVSEPHGYAWEFDNTQHVVYRGTDNHIHELWFTHNTGRWEHVDLTEWTGAPLSFGDVPQGYAWESDATQHVVYRGVDSHIHELWFTHDTHEWVHVDLTSAANAPSALGNPDGYVIEF